MATARIGSLGAVDKRRLAVAPRWSVLLPAAVVAVLSLPCLSLGYFWDDYYFLTLRGVGDARAYLLPSPRAAFYRPITQGLYFLFLRVADPVDGRLAHLLNLLVLAGTACLLSILVSRLSGRRAGLLSGLVFSGFGLAPSLVAWVSCSQDLFACALVLLALLLRHEGRSTAALACATAALFCKEVAIVAFPVIVLWDHLVGRPAEGFRARVISYLAVASIWGLAHPGIRLLVGSGFRSGAAGYFGVEHPERWGVFIVRYLMTLLNLPPPDFIVLWWDSRVLCGLAALPIMALGLLTSERRERAGDSSRPIPTPRVAVIAALLGVPALLMPAILIRHWAPYFALMPAAGMAILVGPILARRSTAVALAILTLFLLLGVRYRGARTAVEPVWSEWTFAEAAKAVGIVRGNFKSLFATFPKGSQVVVSVSSTGVRGIYSTLIEGQALQVWYRDPSLRTVPTLRRMPSARPEFLIRVTSNLDVISIEPDTRRIRTTASYQPDLSELGRPIVNYARAVAAAGDTDRAVRITLSLVEGESGPNSEYAHRLAAMFLLASGRREEARRILDSAAPLTRENALGAVQLLLAEPSASERLDNSAFEAFGLSASDPEALRWIMRAFADAGSYPQAAWYAQRLLQLVPGDAGGTRVLQEAREAAVTPRRSVD